MEILMKNHRITRTSPFSGRTHTIELPISSTKYYQCVDRYQAGELLQEAFSCLDANMREFWKTGITPEEWDTYLDPR